MRLLAVLAFGLAVSGCTLTATRPLQEMSNAEAALKAAKDLHADSLSPTNYRIAVESFFKAKREYKLKNFDAAQKYALRTMKFAERGEFEAYLKGGATPEIESKGASLEGAPADPELAIKQAHELGKKHEDEIEEQKRQERERRAAERAAEEENEPALDEEPVTEERGKIEAPAAGDKNAPPKAPSDKGSPPPPAKPKSEQPEQGAYE